MSYSFSSGPSKDDKFLENWTNNGGKKPSESLVVEVHLPADLSDAEMSAVQEAIEDAVIGALGLERQ